VPPHQRARDRGAAVARPAITRSDEIRLVRSAQTTLSMQSGVLGGVTPTHLER
jgi:hypothetical protein